MLIEKISELDREKITDFIRNYAGGEDAYIDRPMADIERILRFWDDAKDQRLINLFGGELILKKHINISANKEDLENAMSESLANNSEFYNFTRLFSRTCYEHTELNAIYNDICSLIWSESLASNTWEVTSHPVIEFEHPETGKKIKLTKGMKTMRALGKICSEYGIKEEFEKFRIAHSQALNESALIGNLCISIHPLDYMTISDNDSGWESCMSWTNYGDYRQGTVEMMNSENVIVAYLESSSPMKIGDWEWNNKKWRELFVFNGNLLFGVKGYPYQSATLEAEVRNWLAELATKNLGTEFLKEDYFFKGRSVVDADGSLISAVRYTKGHMYADFTFVKDAHHIAKITQTFIDRANNLEAEGKNYRFEYSGVSECMWCGEAWDRPAEGEFLDSCDLCCYSCSNKMRCDYCGETYDGETYYVDDMDICPYCWEDNTRDDEVTGTTHMADRLTPIYLSRHRHKGLDPKNLLFAIHVDLDDCCDPAYDDYFVDGFDSIKRFKEKVDTSYGYSFNSCRYVNLDDLTEEGVALFFDGDVPSVIDNTWLTNEPGDLGD